MTTFQGHLFRQGKQEANRQLQDEAGQAQSQNRQDGQAVTLAMMCVVQVSTGKCAPEAHCWVFLVSLHGMEEGVDICFGIRVVLKFTYVEACSTATSGYLSPQWCGNGKAASATHGSFFLTRPLLGTFCECISLLLVL